MELVKAGEVSAYEAMEAASEPHDLQLMLQQAGLSATGSRTGLSFERDVKPLFDEHQRTQMKGMFDLWDYESVKET